MQLSEAATPSPLSTAILKAISADDRVAMRQRTGGAQGPPEASNARCLTYIDHASIPMGRTGVDAVAIVDLARQSFGGLNKRIAEVAIT